MESLHSKPLTGTITRTSWMPRGKLGSGCPAVSGVASTWALPSQAQSPWILAVPPFVFIIPLTEKTSQTRKLQAWVLISVSLHLAEAAANRL